jgi:hypothetical protein
MIRKLLLLLALTIALPAQAQWREASTRNFIVYSEGGEAELRAFAEKLERFDFVLRRIHRVSAPPSPNRLRVVLVSNQRAVAELAGRSGSGVAGYYVSDARGMLMVGSRNNTRSAPSRQQTAERYFIDSEAVLLHEYTHHFMYQYFPATYPTWYSEGWAEFWGATRFGPNGEVEVGRPVEHRFASFDDGRWLSLTDLLTAQSYADVGEVDLLYAQGWLLVRYAWENPERQRQLQQYLNLINRGSSYTDAARQAFGDLGALNSELRAYAGRARFNVIVLPFRAVDVGEINVRTLAGAEAAMFRSEIEFSQGISNAEYRDFAARVRGEAARFPDDPHALRLLAEVERIGGNTAAAQSAVDRLLARAPNDARGLMMRGLLAIDALGASGNRSPEAWVAARAPIDRARALSPNDPLIQEAFYDSFAMLMPIPPDEAQEALYRAMELAPSDSRLRYKVASDFERRDMIPEAIAIIRPDAYRVPDRRDETESERERRLRREDRYRRAGTARTETPREMLERLLRRQQQQQATQ